MWFLILIISFFIGMFTVFHAFSAMIGIGEAIKEKNEIVTKGFTLTIIIHTFISIGIIALAFNMKLEQYISAIILGYFIIPAIAACCNKGEILKETRKKLRENSGGNSVDLTKSNQPTRDNSNITKGDDAIIDDFDAEFDDDFDENVKEQIDGEFDDLLVLENKISQLYSGNVVMMTLGEVIDCSINLQDYKEGLDNFTYQKIFNIYKQLKSHPKSNVLQPYDLRLFALTATKMQTEFEKLINMPDIDNN